MGITLNTGLSHKEVASLIVNCPEIRVLVEGEPGIGKTSLREDLIKGTGITSVALINAPEMCDGDAAMPALNHETKTTGFYPNERFRMHTGEPVIIIIDELGKATESVRNMLHPLLEEQHPRLGNVPLPPGSYVVTLTNMRGDGVGDNYKAHTLNRLTRVRMRKPTADEWVNEYAVNAGVEPSIIAFASKSAASTQLFASYTDPGQEENYYIFNPRRPDAPCWTPRSASRASKIVKQRKLIGDNATLAALCGTIGEKAAHDLNAYIQFQDELPSWQSIVDSPTGVSVPRSAGALAVLVFGAVTRVEEDTMTPFMKFLERTDETWVATFISTLARSERAKIGYRSPAFTNWVRDNNELL